MIQARTPFAGFLCLALCLGAVRAAEKPAAKPPPAKAKAGAAAAKKPQEPKETAPQRRERLARLYEQAEQHYKAKRFREAQRLYAQIALERPGYKRVNARLRSIRERLEEAERLAREARLERLLEAADAHFAVANYQGAVQACEEILLLEPKNKRAQKRLAEAAGELELQRRITAAIAGASPQARRPEVIAQARTALTPERPAPGARTPEPPKGAPAVRASVEPEPPARPPQGARRVGPGVNVEIVEAGRRATPLTTAPEDPEGSRLLAKAWDTYQAAKLADDPTPELRKALDVLAPITPASKHSRHTKGTAALLRKSIARRMAGGRGAASAEEQRRARLYRRYLEGEEALRKKHFDEALGIAKEILDQDRGFTLARHLRQEAAQRKIDDEREEKDIEHTLRVGKRILEVAEAGAPPDDPAPVDRPLIDLSRPVYKVTSPELDEKLNQRISVNLIDADLDYFLDLLFRSTGVNIIYNPEVVQDKTITVHVANYPLRQLLDYIARNHGLMFATTRDGILLTTPEEPRLETFIIPLHHGLVDVEEAPPSAAVAGEGETAELWEPFTTSNVEKLVEQFPQLIDWPQGAFTYLDRKMNILYVRTTNDAYEKVIELIASVDQQPIQVLIKALFVEVDAEEFESFGTEFELLADDNIADINLKRRIELVINKGKILTFPGELAPGAPTLGPEGETPGLNLSITGIMDEEKFRLTLDLLQRLKNSRTLAAPHVVCMNNCTARIAVTQDLVYIEDYEVDRSDISGTTIGNPFFDQQAGQTASQFPLSSEPIIIPVFAEGEDTGFTLDVSPSVGKDTRFITITLNPRIRELVDTRTFDLVFPVTQVVPPVVQNGNGNGNGDQQPVLEQQTGTVERPIVGERSISTKLTVADGSIVSIGGLMTQRQVAVRSKIPILSDIPLIGWLFGRKTFGTKKTNLLIFVQCELITPTGARYADAGNIDQHAPPTGTPRGGSPPVQLREGPAPAVRPEP